MPQTFNDQGGAASMSPSPLMRWLTSTVMKQVMSPARLQKKRQRIELKRQNTAGRHVVDYFHQVDDGYSHMAAQLLQPLVAQYNIELRCHLVAGPQGDNAAEPALLLELSRYDSQQVAAHYGLQFPSHNAAPAPGLVTLATGILSQLRGTAFIDAVVEVGHSLWNNDLDGLQALAQQLGCASEQAAGECVAAGTALRGKMGHYSGAMFHYGGEWYWGVDRLYHLEQRLIDLAASIDNTDKNPVLLAPRPAIESGPLRDNGSLTLEIYPSLRSPYSAMIFDRTVQLAEDTGVKLVVRPVLPMVMRGVPATRQKGFYIFSDAMREAAALAVPFGKMYDPIGEPVRRCYSLYPWAVEQGKGNALLSAFLKAAFAEGHNTNNDRGLQKVVEAAGLDWQQAREHLGSDDWQQLLENNRQAMYDFGSWGVPSFRLLDQEGHQVLALWGQDRLWFFAREIQRLLAEK